MALTHTLDGHGSAHVLVLHDWLGDATTYDAALPYFDLDALTLARVDLPGYGKSRAEAVRGVDAGALDVDVLAVADQLGWTRFHLVGHSMSSVIAQRMARAEAARILSVTLITPVTPGMVYPDDIVTALRGVARDPARRRAFGQRWGTRLSPRWLEWKLERWERCADPEAVAAYVDLFARADLQTTPAEIQVPVQAILGAEDAPHFQEATVKPALQKIYPAAKIEVCTSASHYPMQETPPLFATLVERFVRANADAAVH